MSKKDEDLKSLDAKNPFFKQKVAWFAQLLRRTGKVAVNVFVTDATKWTIAEKKLEIIRKHDKVEQFVLEFRDPETGKKVPRWKVWNMKLGAIEQLEAMLDAKISNATKRLKYLKRMRERVRNYRGS